MNSQKESGLVSKMMREEKGIDKSLNCLRITLHKQRHTKEAPDMICKVIDLRG